MNNEQRLEIINQVVTQLLAAVIEQDIHSLLNYPERIIESMFDAGTAMADRIEKEASK